MNKGGCYFISFFLASVIVTAVSSAKHAQAKTIQYIHHKLSLFQCRPVCIYCNGDGGLGNGWNDFVHYKILWSGLRRLFVNLYTCLQFSFYRLGIIECSYNTKELHGKIKMCKNSEYILSLRLFLVVIKINTKIQACCSKSQSPYDWFQWYKVTK